MVLNDILATIRALVAGMKAQDPLNENARIRSSTTSTRVLLPEADTIQAITQDREATWGETRDQDKETDTKIKTTFRPEVVMASTLIVEIATTVEVEI